MPSVRAASSALRRSREAIAVTSLHTPFCMPGMTFVTAIFAVLRIPQRTLDIATHHSRGGKTCAGPEIGFGEVSQLVVLVVSGCPTVSRSFLSRSLRIPAHSWHTGRYCLSGGRILGNRSWLVAQGRVIVVLPYA